MVEYNMYEREHKYGRVYIYAYHETSILNYIFVFKFIIRIDTDHFLYYNIKKNIHIINNTKK